MKACPHCGKPLPQRPYSGYLSPHVDEILRRYDAGAGTREIARHLLGQGISPQSAYPRWREEALQESICTIIKRSGRELRRRSYPNYSKAENEHDE